MTFIESMAKKLYNKHTDNDPIMHSNRFAPWEDLDDKAKESWRQRVIDSVGGKV